MFSQDWKPVVFKKKTPDAAIRNGSAVIQTHSKIENSKQQYNSNAKKLEADLDHNIQDVPSVSLNILDPSMRKELISKRIEKGFNQSQLAKMINEQSSVINNLENGKVVNEKNILQKINKILGTKLKFNH